MKVTDKPKAEYLGLAHRICMKQLPESEESSLDELSGLRPSSCHHISICLFV